MKTHTDVKPFKCNQCNKGFIQNIDLKRHMKTHTRRETVSCYPCFGQINELIRHQGVDFGKILAKV